MARVKERIPSASLVSKAKASVNTKTAYGKYRKNSHKRKTKQRDIKAAIQSTATVPITQNPVAM